MYSATAKTRETFAKETGAIAAASIDELVAKLKPPRAIWMMVQRYALDTKQNCPVSMALAGTDTRLNAKLLYKYGDV